MNDHELLVNQGERIRILSGVQTSGIVDSDIVVFPAQTIVSGTRTYTTVLNGQNTVLVFEPFELDPYQEAMLMPKRRTQPQTRIAATAPAISVHALQNLAQSPEYQSARAELKTATQALETAKEHGSTSERMEAMNRVARAKASISALEAKASNDH